MTGHSPSTPRLHYSPLLLNRLLTLLALILGLLIAERHIPRLAQHLLAIVSAIFFIFQINRISAGRRLTWLLISTNVVFVIILLTFAESSLAFFDGKHPLTLHTEPRNVEIYIDEAPMGLEGTYYLKPGVHEITFAKTGYESSHRIVSVPEQQILTVKLQQQVGSERSFYHVDTSGNTILINLFGLTRLFTY